MIARYPRAAAAAAVIALVGGLALAQSSAPAAPPAAANLPGQPQPYSYRQTRPPAPGETAALVEALRAARANEADRASTYQTALQDPVARKLVTWASVDVSEDRLGYFRVDMAQRDLRGWPREDRRFAAAERGLETSGLGPAQTVAWFEGREPVSVDGAIALASALQATGKADSAGSIIRHWWRTKRFSPAGEAKMQARFGGLLRAEDASARRLMLADGATSWTDRRVRMNDAIKTRDYRSAYSAIANHGLPHGADFAEAEFFAGWLALRKLNDAALADRHFARILDAGRSPITRGRGHYWQGRAAEARGDAAGAQAHYAQGGQYTTTFYGQLSAEKAGMATLQLPAETQPTAEDRARFEGRELVRAARLLAAAGEDSLLNVFVLHMVPQLEAGELALLVDLARGYGEPMLAMNVVRAAATRGVVMSERGYPLRTPPAVYGGPEPAFVLGIIRQESGFQPDIRSSAGARGFMQLLPTTAELVARKLGVAYEPGMLTDPEYNMRLGSKYLGDQVDRFSGSYIMAAAAYNAGPGRPAQWIGFCGDPRTGATDPIDFIECIPFSETRNYVMRVLENTQIYRARRAGNVAPITLSADLKRGGWRPGQTAQPYTGPVGGTSPY